MRPSTPKTLVGSASSLRRTPTPLMRRRRSGARAFACALLKASAHANNGPANRVMPVCYEVNSVPPRPASSRVDKFDRRRFGVILSHCDPRKRSIIQNGLDASNPASQRRYFAFCNSDVIDSTILTFADSRSPGDRFERRRRLDGKKCPRCQGLWGEASHAMS